MLALLIAAQVAATPVSLPRFASNEFADRVAAYVQCLRDTALPAGIAHKEILAIDVVNAAGSTKCSRDSVAAMLEGDYMVNVSMQGAKPATADYMGQLNHIVADELNSKRLGF